MKLVAPCALRPGPGGWSKISEARTSRRALLAAKGLYLYEGLMTRQTGTSRAYLLKRLRRDGYGDLLAAVENGRLSAYAAAEAAGYVTRRPVKAPSRSRQGRRTADGVVARPESARLALPRRGRAARGVGEEPQPLDGAVGEQRSPADGVVGVRGRRPSLPRVRSRAFLPVRARPLRRRREGRVPHWREELDRAHSPGLFHCAGPGKFLDRDAARRAHFAWANIPSSLVDAWTAERQTDEDRDA